MLLCPNCNLQNEDAATLCDNCGAALSDPRSADTQPLPGTDTSTPAPSTPSSTDAAMPSEESQASGPEASLESRYEIAEVLGEGGMGRVYRAMDRILRRPVALKLLPPHYAKDESFVKRFVREARIAAALNHPNIIKVYEVGRAAEGAYIAMEYVEGGDIV